MFSHFRLPAWIEAYKYKLQPLSTAELRPESIYEDVIMDYDMVRIGFG